MKSNDEASRFVYHTQGVCPPEIHFQIQKDILKEIRFVGGGCPGNAQAVSRLLRQRPVKEVVALIKDIPCRNDTSCPDQLVKALLAASDGTLAPARSFFVYADPEPRNRIGLIGDLEGRSDVLKGLVDEIVKEDVEKIYCLGNITGNSSSNKDLIGLIRKKGFLAVQGELDWQYAQGKEPDDLPHLEQRERDRLMLLPQALSFQIGQRTGMAFFGGYVQELPGFSDFEPFALEMNMVCSMTDFLKDETVFPAVEAMVPQFEAQVILFSQARRWGHWRIGEADFISLGPAANDKGLTWGLLEDSGKEIHFRVIRVD